MPPALKEGLPGFQEAFRVHGVPSLSFPGLEADDVVATLASKVSERGGRVRVLSTDKMFLQLVSERICVRDHFAQRDLDKEYVRGKFGVGPEQIVDFLALTGDATNHIPGVPGVGPKRASALLREFGSLEAVLSGAPRVKGSLGDTLGSHGDAARLAYSLVRLRTDLELGVNLKSFRFVGTGGA
jgi:protein Xni